MSKLSPCYPCEWYRVTDAEPPKWYNKPYCKQKVPGFPDRGPPVDGKPKCRYYMRESGADPITDVEILQMFVDDDLGNALDDLDGAPLAQLLALQEFELDGEDLSGYPARERKRVETALAVRKEAAAAILARWPKDPKTGDYVPDNPGDTHD